MNYILSHQSATTSGHDILLIDGMKSEYTGTTEQREVMALLKGNLYKHNYTYLKSCINGCSPSLTIRTNGRDTELLVESHFLSSDEKGRKIPYAFYIKNTADIAAVKWTMEQAANQVGMQINKADSEVVAKVLRLGPKVRVAGVVAAVMLVAAILIIIF